MSGAPLSQTRGTLPSHFHSLDALRGLAALAVVLWHWQHFFAYDGAYFARSLQPLYSLFSPFYDEGWRAVDLFFCLSGFIFYWLYAEKVRDRKTTAAEFFVLRFSRLYPLHLLTLLLVLGLQQVMVAQSGAYFVYRHNDAFHFLLQVLFVSNWGWESGYSFNGPIWSVSIEMLLYVVFFIACTLNLRRWSHILLFVFAGYLLIEFGYIEIGRGLFSFFTGVAAFRIFSVVANRRPSRISLLLLAGITAFLWVLVPFNHVTRALHGFYREHMWTEFLMIGGQDAIGTILLTLTRYSYELFLFPLTIVTLALWEAERGSLGRRLSFLGQMSYSAYLLHFPLQIVFFGVVLALGVPVTFFYSIWSLVLFMAVLVPLSLGCYHFFERPCQSSIRRMALEWIAATRKPKRARHSLMTPAC